MELPSRPSPSSIGWPQADFIVGNPPFIGASEIRRELGDGKAEALWEAYPDVPESSDFVMFWWEKAALAARAYDPAKGKGTRRFGFITTNSLRQTFRRSIKTPTPFRCSRSTAATGRCNPTFGATWLPSLTC
jgi:hypothetical protein